MIFKHGGNVASLSCAETDARLKNNVTKKSTHPSLSVLSAYIKYTVVTNVVLELFLPWSSLCLDPLAYLYTATYR